MAVLFNAPFYGCLFDFQPNILCPFKKGCLLFIGIFQKLLIETIWAGNFGMKMKKGRCHKK